MTTNETLLAAAGEGDSGRPEIPCDMQLGVTYGDYAAAAQLLWGDAGRYAYAEFRRLNQDLFAGELPPLPIVFGLTAYGRCIGLTRHPGQQRTAPRITLSTVMVNKGGERTVTDVVTHEMVHAVLMLRGQTDGHSHGDAWCRLITELSPAVLGHEITAHYVAPRRIPNPAHATDPNAPKTIVVRQPLEGALPQPVISRWPGSLRPPGYDTGQPLRVENY
jgi:SprT-like family